MENHVENRNLGQRNIIDLIFGEIQSEMNRMNEDQEESDNAVFPASKEFIDSLEEIDIEEEDKTCSICLEEFKIGDKCFKLPCKDHSHYFHGEKENCMGIKKWLHKSNTCPVCRTEFPKETNQTGSENGSENGIGDGRVMQIDNRIGSLMRSILTANVRILNPRQIIEMEEQRQLDAAIQASLEDQ